MIQIMTYGKYIENECFYEGVSITREEFFVQLNNGKQVSTSQQSPEAIKWDLEVMCDQLSMGISCHTGAGVLGIGCSCRPGRLKG